jgi:type IV pilus assembly protein PilM
VVTGPAIAIPGFVEKLSDALRLPLEGRVVEHGDDLENAGRLTVAAGLAVAERP